MKHCIIPGRQIGLWEWILKVNPRWINEIPNKVFYSKNPYLKIKIDLSGKDPVIKSVNPKLRFKSVHDQKAKSWSWF